eukprot:COSAG02_NODE_4813_length_4949_cov_2.146598_4_plen_238_part_00
MVGVRCCLHTRFVLQRAGIIPRYRRPFAGQVLHNPPQGDIRAWNFFDVQSVGGGFVTHKSTLQFFFSGRSHTHLNRPSVSESSSFYYTNSSTGTGTLRRDGFAALHPSGGTVGTVSTFMLQFDEGDTLHVNANTSAGRLMVQVEDESGKSLPKLSFHECDGMSNTDSTDEVVTWAGKSALLAALEGKPFQLTFELHGEVQLYSFWVGRSECGSASRGFVAAGSADVPGPRDVLCEKV